MDSKHHILVAEDNEDDIFILQATLKRVGIRNPVQFCRTGQEVVEYLRGEGAFVDRSQFPIPRLLLLDLKMPVMSGLDVLRWMRENPKFAIKPTIVLTSSRHEVDVNSAYELGANAYLVKPGRLEDFEQVLQLMEKFWNACELPSRE